MNRSSPGDEGGEEHMPWDGREFSECVGQKEGQWGMGSKMRLEWYKGPNHIGHYRPC